MPCFTGSTSDHKLVVADVRGTDVASMIAPIEAPDLIQWTNCPKVPFDCLSQELKAKWAPMFHALQAATSEQHWNTADPVTSLQASLLSVAATHLGTKKYRTKQRTCWWNHGLTKLSRRVRRAHRRTQLPNLSEAKLRRHKAQHKAVEKQYRQACTKARRRALSDFQAHFEPRDMNRTWRQLNHTEASVTPGMSRESLQTPMRQRTSGLVSSWNHGLIAPTLQALTLPGRMSSNLAGRSLQPSLR